ncbi:hypothetical protein E3N88_09783 [Mikania micrantha]|uniref:ARID domain-containing protein n=1 Tax=Mikania micrantha TaxID=192012 RepID=A0A5N6PKY6_9ASTR|nr:hypothetical protein E3N88_09783 [Mikania micrantha]
MEDFRSKSYNANGMQIQPYNNTNLQDFRCYSTSHASTSSYQTQMDHQNEPKFKKTSSRSTNGSMSKSWSFTDPELQRKKRVASYKAYTVEGKVKGSIKKSFRWIKDKYTQMVYGMKRNANDKEPMKDMEPLEVYIIEKMVIFLDLLGTVNRQLLYEENIKIRFNKMVKWFNKCVIKKNEFWVPVMDGEEVNLYHLYMVVPLIRGKNNVTKHGFWPLIAAEMMLVSRKGFQLLLQYNEHMEMMHWYNMNLKKRKLELGESSAAKDATKKDDLPYKKRRTSAIRSWPPECRPATKKRA